VKKSPNKKGKRPAGESTLKAENEVLKEALREIQALASTLTPEDPNKLQSSLGDLESKISALRSFVWNHLIKEKK
jgi:hypothetical protein